MRWYRRRRRGRGLGCTIGRVRRRYRRLRGQRRRERWDAWPDPSFCACSPAEVIDPAAWRIPAGNQPAKAPPCGFVNDTVPVHPAQIRDWYVQCAHEAQALVPVGVQHSPQNPGQTHAAHVNAIEAGHDSRAVGAPALFLRAATPRAVGPRRHRGARAPERARRTGESRFYREFNDAAAGCSPCPWLPSHKPFESAGTARGLRALDLVGALLALWRAERAPYCGIDEKFAYCPLCCPPPLGRGLASAHGRG